MPITKLKKKKRKQRTGVDEDVMTKEFLYSWYTIGRNVKRSTCYRKQKEGFKKQATMELLYNQQIHFWVLN